MQRHLESEQDYHAHGDHPETAADVQARPVLPNERDGSTPPTLAPRSIWRHEQGEQVIRWEVQHLGIPVQQIGLFVGEWQATVSQFTVEFSLGIGCPVAVGTVSCGFTSDGGQDTRRQIVRFPLLIMRVAGWPVTRCRR